MRSLLGMAIGTLLISSVLLTTVFASVGIIDFSNNNSEFAASVDSDEGTNRYALVEIDEGDNNEETSITLIFHEFQFKVNDNSGAISWDFSDGTTGVGSEIAHEFESPGVYKVTATSVNEGTVKTSVLTVTVHLDATAEVDNMECACAPTGKDTVIDLLAHTGTMSLDGYVMVEHDGSSESCSLRNPLQECHLRVVLERTEMGNVVAQELLFDDTFRSNELIVDFSFVDLEFEDGQGLQLRLETDQLRDWHKPMAAWSASAPIQ